MKPTEILMEEHRAIKKMLEVIDAMCEKISSGEDVPIGDMEDVVNFIQTFADRCHHAKEEDVLFIAMEEAGIPKEGGPVAVMLLEHTRGRGYVREMKKALENHSENKDEARKIFVENALNYRNLLDEHIDKEDNILYRIAELHIPEERQLNMLEEFKRVEEEKVGRGVHEKMHSVLHSLIEKYLR